MKHLLSDVNAFRRDPLTFFSDVGNSTTQQVAPLRIGLGANYLVVDPGLARQVFVAPEQRIAKGRVNLKLRQILGDSSITLSGDENIARRSAIHKNLHAGLSGKYIPETAATIRQIALQLTRERDFDAPRVCSGLALRCVCNLVFGRDVLTPGDESAIIEAVHLVESDLADSMFRALPRLPWNWYRGKQRLRQARATFAFVVDKARGKATESALVRSLEAIGLQGDALRDELLLMIIAGHHTTGAAAAWLLLHLARDSDLSCAIATEAKSLGDDAGELVPARLKDGRVSRSLVNEILRLYPSSYWMARELQQDLELGDVAMRKGTTLIVSPWHLHRDPRYWQDPNELRLNRSYASKAYIPFGVGQRACIGMSLAVAELQLLALEMSAAFDLKLSVPPARDRPLASVTLLPPDFRLSIALRKEPASVRRAA